MAYIVGVLKEYQASGTTYTPTYASIGFYAAGDSIQTNDLIMVGIANRNTGPTTLNPGTGFTGIGTFGTVSNQAHRWFYKVATAPETSVAFTVENNETIGVVLVIRDADTSTPIDVASARQDWSGTSSVASSTPTTTTDGTLNIISMSGSSISRYPRLKINDAIQAVRYDATSSIGLSVAYRTQKTAGAAAAVTWYANQSGGGGNGWVIAIKNKTNGAKQPDVKTNITELNWYGDHGATHSAVTWQAASSFAASINGITCTATAPTTGTAAPIGTNLGTFTYLQSSVNTAGAWVGGTHTISSTDMTGCLFAVEYFLDFSSIISRVGADGVIIAFSDGTNWVAYQVNTKAKSWSANFFSTPMIALGNATAYASSGSINWGAVTRIGYFWHRAGSSASADTMEVRNALLIYTAKSTTPAYSASLVFGGSNRPASAVDYQRALTSWEYRNIAVRQGNGQILAKTDVVYGDGTNPTYADASATSIEYPQGWNNFDNGNWQMDWNVGTLACTIGVKTSSTDTINNIAAIDASLTQQYLTVDAGSNTAATVSVAGTSFIGLAPTWKTGIACNSCTFKSCGIIDFKGADITSVIANNGTGTALMSASDGFSATGCTFTASTTAVYGIRIAAAGTFDLASTTFSGFTKDIDVTATTGTVTINLAAGQATPTYQTAGATVTIVSSPVFQTVTISNLVVGSRVQIYDTTSSTELANATATGGNIVFSGGGTVATWTDPSAATASRAIRLRVAKQSGATAYNFIDANIGTCGTTAGTQAVSYLANQTADTTYNANAIDGSGITDITIDVSGGNRVKIAKAGGAVTWPQIYAYQVYWQFTATGIAQETAFIEAPDTANYLLTDFDIKNTHATVPLTITGGWGRDSVTLTVAGCIDTSGTSIFPEPDHVTAYATGSALTAGQAASLSAAETYAALGAGTRVLEGAYTFDEVVRIMAAALAGKASGLDGTSARFRDLGDTKNRIVATVDANGNRTAVTLDGA